MTITLPAAGLPLPIYGDLLPAVSEVPLRFEVGLNGRGFYLDPTKLQYQTLPQLRQAFDQGPEPGGQSKDPAGVWQRSQISWEHGAGQVHFDRADSDRSRFFSSKGLDPWTKGQIGLLHDTERVDPASTVRLLLVETVDKIWKAEGATLSWSSTGNAATWNAVTLTGIGANILGLTTDGTYVYACDAANIFRVDATTPATVTPWSTQNATNIWFANDRLLVDIAGALNELTAIGGIAAGSPLKDLGAGSTWNSVVAASNGIYAASTAGNVSQIWHIGNDPATGGLTVPVIAAAWVRGETINVLGFYAQIMCIGTSDGFRIATLASGDFLNYGSLTPIPGGVTAFAFEDRFAWFSWSNYDGGSTGLGRIDLSVLVQPDRLAFAYASDLMAAGNGDVTSIVRYADKTYFSVANNGVYRTATNLVPSGVLHVGQVAFNDVEDKLLLGVRVGHLPLAGSILAQGGLPDGTVGDGGTSTLVGSTRSLPLGFAQQKEAWVDPLFTLYRSATDPTAGPQLTLWQVRAMPTGSRPETIRLPLLMEESVENEAYDPLEVRAWLRSIQQADLPVVLQLGSENLTVVIDTIAMDGLKRWVNVNGSFGMGGTILVSVTTIENV